MVCHLGATGNVFNFIVVGIHDHQGDIKSESELMDALHYLCLWWKNSFRHLVLGISLAILKIFKIVINKIPYIDKKKEMDILCGK